MPEAIQAGAYPVHELPLRSGYLVPGKVVHHACSVSRRRHSHKPTGTRSSRSGPRESGCAPEHLQNFLLASYGEIAPDRKIRSKRRGCVCRELNKRSAWLRRGSSYQSSRARWLISCCVRARTQPRKSGSTLCA